MASYKILKQVDGLELVLDVVKQEAKWCFDETIPEKTHIFHYERFQAICETLEMLGIVDSAQDMKNTVWHESWK